MSKLQIIGKAASAVCFTGAVLSLAVGTWKTEKIRATTDHFATLYDGPWLPVEFGLLFAGVVCFRESDPDEPVDSTKRGER